MPRSRYRARLQGIGPSHNEKIRFARKTRKIIGWVGGGLAMFFGYLQVKNIALAPLVSSINPDTVWHVALILYYTSWIAGTLFDTDIQELVYTEFPSKDKWCIQSIGVVIVLALAAAVLCWAEGDVRRFSFALVLFMIVDHAAWRFLIWYLKPAGAKSRQVYQDTEDYFAVETLNVVVSQVQGNWKWWRLTVGLPLAGLIAAFAFLDSVRTVLLELINSILPGLSASNGDSIVASGLVLIWVVAVELWHWIIRVETHIKLDFLEHLQEVYALRPAHPG